MVERGVGRYQKDKALDSESLILSVLNDGEWHRYQEILEKTGLSTATLSKHLKRLEKGIIEKRIDLESGEYPYPVYYRITPKMDFLRGGVAILVDPQISKKVIEKGMIADLIHYINFCLSLRLLKHFEQYFRSKNKRVNEKEAETTFYETVDLLLLNAYRETIYQLMEGLKRKSRKEDVQRLLSEAAKQIIEDYTKNGLGMATQQLANKQFEEEILGKRKN